MRNEKTAEDENQRRFLIQGRMIMTFRKPRSTVESHVPSLAS